VVDYIRELTMRVYLFLCGSFCYHLKIPLQERYKKVTG